MEVSGQLHALVGLGPGEEPLELIKEGAGWASELVSKFLKWQAAQRQDFLQVLKVSGVSPHFTKRLTFIHLSSFGGRAVGSLKEALPRTPKITQLQGQIE